MPPTPQDEPPSADMETPPLRILLVEDDEFDVAVFNRAFRKSEIACEIIRCRRGEEALEGLRDARLELDLLVADFNLPGMTGLELCETLIAQKPPFAVVLLTGGGSEQMAIQALKAGVQDYIVKDSSQEYLELLPLVLPKAARQYHERRMRERADAELRTALRAAVTDSTPDSPSVGLDLRLSSCTDVVQQMGGRMWVETEGEAGSTLHFSIPLADDAAAVLGRGDRSRDAVENRSAAAVPRHLRRDAGERPLQVLIAHPNSVVSYVASRVVEDLGYHFSTVENGQQAMVALDHEPVDLLLIAATMRPITGMEATRQIRQGKRPRMPIIALAVDPAAGEVEACEAAGMDDNVHRPIDAASLTAAIARVLPED